MLKKEAALFSRDEKGELIPQEVELEINENDEEQVKYRGETVVITPMPRGEVRRLFATVISDNKEKDQKNKEKMDEEPDKLDIEIVFEHCKNPVFTKEDMVYMKPWYLNMIANTILKESGISVNKSKKKALEEKEDEFSKN